MKQAGGLEVMALSPTTSGAIFHYLIDDDVCLDFRSFVAWVSPRRRVYAPSSAFGQGENDLRPGETADCFAARALWAQSGALPAGHRMGYPIEGEEGLLAPIGCAQLIETVRLLERRQTAFSRCRSRPQKPLCGGFGRTSRSAPARDDKTKIYGLSREDI